MVRISSSVTAKRRKKRVYKQTKGQFLKRRTNFKQAKKSLIKGLQYAYRDRRRKKRDFRSLWIVRIKAACLQEGMTYSRFISGLAVAKVGLNRKMLAEIAVSAPEVFKQLVGVAKKAATK
jgi:large subunit ribosomal protein L20